MSVEHSASVGFLQTCVDFVAMYGKSEIGNALYMRKTVSRETAANVKVWLTEHLKDAIDEELCPSVLTCSQTTIGSSQQQQQRPFNGL